jgi:tetratricopeptide (TPR) repeat protein
VSHTSHINPSEFVERVQPLLEKQDFQGLLKLLRCHWSSDQIKELLSCKCGDARKVATLALGLVGARCCIPSLAHQLQDPDPLANQMAEHALWSIWFRCGSECANGLLTRGAAAMDAREFETAEKLFAQAIEADPAFAEAYHQRAIVRCLTDRYADSIADCLEVVQRMPCHFGAWAGMGHAHAHLGQLPDAIRCYIKALKINPHLECLDQAVKDLRKQLSNHACDESADESE